MSTKSYPRFWRLDGEQVAPCSREEWKAFRSDAVGFCLAKTWVEPGFLIQTQFIGVQERVDSAPELFRTSVFSDLGEHSRGTRTWEDARLLHTMEVQRIQSVVDRNFWHCLSDD